MTMPVSPAASVNARPIGLFHLVDRGAADEKVLAVPTGDPYSDGLNDLGDVPPALPEGIEHFFQVYKDLEGTRTVRGGSRAPRQPGGDRAIDGDVPVEVREGLRREDRHRHPERSEGPTPPVSNSGE